MRQAFYLTNLLCVATAVLLIGTGQFTTKMVAIIGIAAMVSLSMGLRREIQP